MRRATITDGSICLDSKISIHALLAESDTGVSTHRKTVQDFYPRSPCGERLEIPLPCLAIHNFYPRSPCGERPETAHERANRLAFLSTLSLRRATARCRFWALSNAISIHALLAESDADMAVSYSKGIKISIHALLAESDNVRCQGCPVGVEFLSTLSLRRATLDELCRMMGIKHFYPRSPCGERRQSGGTGIGKQIISIHALLAESDKTVNVRSHGNNDFYPRSPCGERQEKPRQTRTDINFYPRSPCGERQYAFKGV